MTKDLPHVVLYSEDGVGEGLTAEKYGQLLAQEAYAAVPALEKEKGSAFMRGLRGKLMEIIYGKFIALVKRGHMLHGMSQSELLVELSTIIASAAREWDLLAFSRSRG